MITAEEVKEHNGEGEDGSFWCCVDGFVVDATSFLDSHPGGLRKLLSSDSAEVGHTGQPFGFRYEITKTSVASAALFLHCIHTYFATRFRLSLANPVFLEDGTRTFPTPGDGSAQASRGIWRGRGEEGGTLHLDSFQQLQYLFRRMGSSSF